MAAALLLGAVIGRQSVSVLGRWEGESRCVGKPSACHDEHVLYQVDSTGPGKFRVDGSRVAGADTVDMGPLSCAGAGAPNAIVCQVPAGTWRFAVVGDHLEGTLTLPDRTLGRRVVARRRQP